PIDAGPGCRCRRAATSARRLPRRRLLCRRRSRLANHSLVCHARESAVLAYLNVLSMATADAYPSPSFPAVVPVNLDFFVRCPRRPVPCWLFPGHWATFLVRSFSRSLLSVAAD